MPKMRLPHPEELLPLDPRYPAALRALKDHGPIRVAGVLPELERAVAIVGTRRADPEALDFAHGLARDLASAGIVILSGGALGVDAAAHRGALAANGKTVAVLASGFAKPYPPSHGPLFEEIAASGALLTEAPDEGAFEGFRFLHRNRLIAALGHSGTIVIQAPIRSGTLSTAEDARRLKRPVWVVPGAPWDPRSQGGLGLLREGARICTSAGDVLSVLAPETRDVRIRSAPSQQNTNDLGSLDDAARLCLSALGGRGRTLDELCKATGWPAPRALAVLTSLEVGGWIEGRSGGRYGIVGHQRRP
ncbi:MAG: DNA-processing protein DprA [Sandaracinaceae bacterium]|jgi:DNA processing protein|nr:DNA-processing protein DprA [Sandaracinaceae bacterium]MBK7775580.1 DNA-processing protein DprA [Sandaracinaceae bacterium]